MKYKMTAVLVALAMMFAGVFVMADGDGADAEDTTVTFDLVAGGSEGTCMLYTNMKAYDTETGYSFTAPTWAIKDGTSMAKDNITYTVTAVDTLTGVYSVTAKAAEEVVANTYNHTLTCTVVVTVSTSNTITLEKEYAISTKVTAKMSATLNAINDVIVNVPYSKQITSSDTSFTVANYDWYAIGLPDGLGMSKTGYIAGIVTEAATVSNVKVTAVENNASQTAIPKTYSFTLSVTAKASAVPTVTVTFDGATVVDGNDGKTITFDSSATDKKASPSDTVYAEKDDAVKIKVTSSGTTLKVVKVVTVSSEGKETESTYTDDMTLDTAGTGSYKTKIYATVDGQSMVLVFNLIVVENLHGDWSPAIIINGN